MKLSSKVALQSALIFPGIGHITLKYYARAFFFIIVSGISLYFLLESMFSALWPILETIQQGRVSLPNAIKILLQKIIELRQMPSLMVAQLVAIACWFASTLDAYNIGKKREVTERMNQPS